jgi:hypothetical protein
VLAEFIDHGFVAFHRPQFGGYACPKTEGRKVRNQYTRSMARLPTRPAMWRPW